MADIEVLMPLIKQFMPFAKERMGFQDPPRLFLKGDSDNAANPLGRTAFYDPAEKAVTLYITGRHPKDIMRSLSHELVHHCQNCNGDFDNAGEMGAGYAQNNPHMREMERQAYEIGNMCFRDWEDSIKQTIYFEHLQKGDKTMSTKDWKNKEIKSLLSEAWGFKMDLDQLNEGSDQNPQAGREESEGDDPPGWAEKNLEEEEDSTAELTEDSEEEETEHYGEDESADKREEDDLEHDEDRMRHHLDRIEHHLKKLRDDMGYDQSHEWSRHDESAETDVETIEEEEEIEERARGRRHQKQHDPARDDERTRPMEESDSTESKLREAVRKAIKDAMK